MYSSIGYSWFVVYLHLRNTKNEKSKRPTIGVLIHPSQNKNEILNYYAATRERMEHTIAYIS